MGTISLRRLSDKTLKKYLELEKQGKLTPRQKRALAGHRSLVPFVETVAKRAQWEGKKYEDYKEDNDERQELRRKIRGYISYTRDEIGDLGNLNWYRKVTLDAFRDALEDVDKKTAIDFIIDYLMIEYTS